MKRIILSGFMVIGLYVYQNKILNLRQHFLNRLLECNGVLVVNVVLCEDGHLLPDPVLLVVLLEATNDKSLQRQMNRNTMLLCLIYISWLLLRGGVKKK